MRFTALLIFLLSVVCKAAPPVPTYVGGFIGTAGSNANSTLLNPTPSIKGSLVGLATPVLNVSYPSKDGQFYREWSAESTNTDGSTNVTYGQGFNINSANDPVTTNATLSMFYESHEIDGGGHSLKSINYEARHSMFGLEGIGQYIFYDDPNDALFNQAHSTFGGDDVTFRWHREFANNLLFLGLSHNNCEMIFPTGGRIGFHAGVTSDLIDAYDSTLAYHAMVNWDAINKVWNFVPSNDAQLGIGTDLWFPFNSIIGSATFAAFRPKALLLLGTGGIAVGTGNDPGPGIIATTNQVQILGTTNFIVFGATNVAPASTATPTKWVSVQINGEGTKYRIPLYQ